MQRTQRYAVHDEYDGPVVQVKAATRTYRNGGDVVHAVRDISVEVPASTMVLVQGKSGSGKTTLLNLMGGLERPSSGSVVYKGREFSRYTRRQTTVWRRTEAGFVFQSLALLPGLTAIENVDLAARIAGVGPREAIRRAEYYLHALGLTARASHRVSELSGGEQQRVAVARGLVTEPKILFADEPTGELDHALSRRVMDILRAVVDEKKTTICLTSHDPAVIAYADVVWTLSDGAITSMQPRSRDSREGSSE
ncbi:MAG: ABC transporter ATP-binding protein [Spirochaetaceae bacterium]|nr:MAG: ABC transporter ATP-binding protein [Spirochaetaceae bacterium]